MIIDTDNKISTLVASQFPAFYNEEGPNFIAFVQAYFEWMQSANNPLQLARALPSYRDIDSTLDQFIVFFKNKYLSDVQFNVASNKRLLIKNSLDYYRAKGTPRAVDLLFRLVYGVSAAVYYPGADVFRLSAGSWTKPYYLEVTHYTTNVAFVGKQVVGTLSGATAFVEKLVRKRVRSNYIDVFYISDIKGNFETNELVCFDGLTENLPAIIGSVTDIEIIAGGQDFAIGDKVEIISAVGDQGSGIISDVEDVTGVVEFTLVDGGFGYTVNSQIFVSDRVLSISHVDVTNTKISNSYLFLETVTQPLVQLNYVNAAGQSITNGTVIEQYDGGGNTIASGVVIETVTINSTAGDLLVSPTLSNTFVAANLNSTWFAIQGNTGSANISLFADITASGLVIGDSANVVFECTNTAGTFQIGEMLAQGNSSAKIVDVAQSGLATTISTVNSDGIFTDSNISGANSGATAVVINIKQTLGLINTTASFVSFPGNYLFGQGSHTFAQIDSVSRGSFANASVGSLLFPEQVTLNFDLLAANNTGNVPYISMFLDGHNSNVTSNGYGFPKGPPVGFSGLIFNSLTFDQTTIGTIGTLTNVNPGIDYTANPFVVALEKETFAARKYDYVIGIDSATRNFAVGEIVQQSVSYPNTATLTLNHAQTFSINQFIYQSNGTANVATATIQSVTIAANVGSAIVNSVVGTFTTAYPITTINGNTANVTSIDSTPYAVLVQGIVEGGNSSLINVKRISLADFTVSNVAITGKSSNATALVVSVAPDHNNNPIGINANIVANVATAEGTVAGITITNSGFGYPDRQLVTFQSEDGARSGSGLIILKKQGQSDGYYSDSVGQLSSNSSLFDGDFYQQYSYQVLTRLPFDKYADVLKKTLHVAGTAVFGKIIFDSDVESEIVANQSITPRTLVLHFDQLLGSCNVGDTITQGNAFAVVVSPPTSQITTSLTPPPLVGTQIVQGANTATVDIVDSGIIYCSNMVGTMSAAVTNYSRSIGSNLQPIFLAYVGSAVGSFNSGDVITSGSNSATVIQANSSAVLFQYSIGSFNVGSRIIGSVGSANIVSVGSDITAIVNSTSSFVILQQTDVHLVNAVGSFSVGDSIWQSTRTSAANISFSNSAVGRIMAVNGAIISITNQFGNFANNQSIGATSGSGFVNNLRVINPIYGVIDTINSSATSILVVPRAFQMLSNVTISNGSSFGIITNGSFVANASGSGKSISTIKNTLKVQTDNTFVVGSVAFANGSANITSVSILDV